PEPLRHARGRQDQSRDHQGVGDDRRSDRRGRGLEAGRDRVHGHLQRGDVEDHHDLCEHDDDHRRPRRLRRLRNGNRTRAHADAPRVAWVDAKRFKPSRSDRNRVASCPRTLAPLASTSGENVASLPLPGAIVTMPPLTPLLPGSPTSYSHSPERSYIPAAASTARTRLHTKPETTGSPLTGFTPPSASVAPIVARSTALTLSAH